MKCSKCDGFMSYEKFYYWELEDFSGWRCVVCGEIISDVVLENRAKS
jgi:hypothetical protein